MAAAPGSLRGFGALALLLAVLVGVPVALAVLGGNPLPAAITWESLRQALFAPDDGGILLGLVTLVGWLAWLVFTVSVLSELVTLLSRQRIRVNLPGLAGPQRVAAGLLLSVVAMVAAPIAPMAPTPLAPTALAQPVDPEPERRSPRADARPAAETTLAPDRRVHVVQPGDDLWSLAAALLRRGARVASDRSGQPGRTHRRTRPAAGRLAAGRSRGRNAAQGRKPAHGDRTPGRDPVVDRRAGARLCRSVAGCLPGQPGAAHRSGRVGRGDGPGHPRPRHRGAGRATGAP